MSFHPFIPNVYPDQHFLDFVLVYYSDSGPLVIHYSTLSDGIFDFDHQHQVFSSPELKAVKVNL